MAWNYRFMDSRSEKGPEVKGPAGNTRAQGPPSAGLQQLYHSTSELPQVYRAPAGVAGPT